MASSAMASSRPVGVGWATATARTSAPMGLPLANPRACVANPCGPWPRYAADSNLPRPASTKVTPRNSRSGRMAIPHAAGRPMAVDVEVDVEVELVVVMAGTLPADS
jgi:hypothetical protein